MIAWAFGFLVLRRRGVYFSLLTLALSALIYSVAFRWTAFTGGENGLGGITRRSWLGVVFDSAGPYYALVAGVAFVAVLALWRFHRSPLGTVLVAIRENEQRAQFVGYATNRYKQIAFVVSAGLTGLAGVLFAFNNRLASADPISVAFSGELLAMVIIGGMRSFLGPALGALFFILFRDYLSLDRELAAVLRLPVRRLHRVLADRAGRPVRARHGALAQDGRRRAAMAQRLAGRVPLPEFLRPPRRRRRRDPGRLGPGEELRRHPAR